MARTNIPLWISLVLGAIAWAGSPPAEMAGCQDLKLFGRVQGCIIIECSTKSAELVKLQMTASRAQSLLGPASSVKYSCPSPVTLDKVMADLVPTVKKAEFEIVYEDNEDDSRIITAKQNGVWVDVDASSDDGAVVYSLTTVEPGPPKPLTGDVCSEAPPFPLPKGCALTDCTSKRKDSVQMRYSAKIQVDVAGAARVSGIACDAAITPATFFDEAVTALKASGYVQVFTQREKPEYSWLTARQGKRWLELMSFQDSDAINFQLTDVQALVDPKIK